MNPRRQVFTVVFAVFGVIALGRAVLFWRADGRPAAALLDGRLGGHVSTFDRRHAGAGQVETSPFRRIFSVPDGRLLLDLARNQHVRQVTVGRDRSVNDTRQPDPGDWSLDRAKALARAYLPPDATLLHSEPFVFRGENAGLRDVFRSAALASVFPAEIYAEHGATGPPGLCSVTYYQTTAAGVAFLLVGLQ